MRVLSFTSVVQSFAVGGSRLSKEPGDGWSNGDAIQADVPARRVQRDHRSSDGRGKLLRRYRIHKMILRGNDDQQPRADFFRSLRERNAKFARNIQRNNGL